MLTVQLLFQIKRTTTLKENLRKKDGSLHLESFFLIDGRHYICCVLYCWNSVLIERIQWQTPYWDYDDALNVLPHVNLLCHFRLSIYQVYLQVVSNKSVWHF